MNVCDRHPSALSNGEWVNPKHKGSTLQFCEHCNKLNHDGLLAQGWLFRPAEVPAEPVAAPINA